jgi:hypothetical protein
VTHILPSTSLLEDLRRDHPRWLISTTPAPSLWPCAYEAVIPLFLAIFGPIGRYMVVVIDLSLLLFFRPPGRAPPIITKSNQPYHGLIYHGTTPRQAETSVSRNIRPLASASHPARLRQVTVTPTIRRLYIRSSSMSTPAAYAGYLAAGSLAITKYPMNDDPWKKKDLNQYY